MLSENKRGIEIWFTTCPFCNMENENEHGADQGIYCYNCKELYTFDDCIENKTELFCECGNKLNVTNRDNEYYCTNCFKTKIIKNKG